MSEQNEQRLNNYSIIKERNITSCLELENCLKKIDINELSPFKERAKELKEKREKIEEDSIKISVAAEFSSGKSTFLNSLIFKDNVLESSIGETTSTLYEIKSSEDDKCHLDSNGEKISCGFSEIKEMIKKKNKEFKTNTKWTKVVVEIPHEKLKKGVIIFDTPGFGSLNDTIMTPIIESSLSKSDAVLLILGVDQGFKKSESEKVSRLMHAFNPDSWYIVLNKIDGYMDEDNYEELINQIKEQTKNNLLNVLDNKTGNIKIYTLSAKYAYKNDKPELKKMFEKFEDDFWKDLLLKKENFLKNRFDELKKFKKSVSEGIASINDNMNENIESLNNIIADTLKKIDKIKTDKSIYTEDLENEIKNINDFLNNKKKEKDNLRLEIASIIFSAIKVEIDKIGFWDSFSSDKEQFKKNIIKSIEKQSDKIEEKLKDFIKYIFGKLDEIVRNFNNTIEHLNSSLSDYKNYGWKESDKINVTYNPKNNEFNINFGELDKAPVSSYDASGDLLIGSISSIGGALAFDSILGTIGAAIGVDLAAALGEAVVPILGWVLAAGTLIYTIFSISDKIEKNKEELKVKFKSISEDISYRIMENLDNKILLKLDDGFSEILYRIKAEIKNIERQFNSFLNVIENPEEKYKEIEILKNNIQKIDNYEKCISAIEFDNFN